MWNPPTGPPNDVPLRPADVRREIAQAIDTARGKLGEAFRLNRVNQDGAGRAPGAVTDRRARNERIVQLCESAIGLLDEQTGAIAARVARARRAPEILVGVRGDLEILRAHLPQARVTVEQLAARFFQTRAVALGVGAELVKIDAGGGELERMADQPALDLRHMRLDVELQRQHPAPIGAERLIRRDRGFGEPHRAHRQVESIAVPMQHPAFGLAQRIERRFASVRREPDQAPADLLLARGIDAGAEHRGDKLRAEADADHGLAAGEHRLDHGELGAQERIAVELVDADRTAEHDENVGVLGLRQVVDASLQGAQRDAARGECIFQRARVLEANMSDGDGFFHGSLICAGRTCAWSLVLIVATLGPQFTT